MNTHNRGAETSRSWLAQLDLYLSADGQAQQYINVGSSVDISITACIVCA
jgi:hypothetical protein